MEEFDVGRLLAAAAPPPDAVPGVADLPARARTLGRRQRVRRAVVTGGGSGMAIAAVVGVVVAAGGLGNGSGSSAAVGTQPGNGKNSITSKPPTKSAVPLTPLTSPTHDSDAATKLTAALKAALPAKWQEPSFFRGGGTKGSYAAEYTWGQGQQEVILDLSATTDVYTGGGAPSLCQENASHCATGTATLLGHQVSWQYLSGGVSGGPNLTVTDSKGPVSYSYGFKGPDASLFPGLDVMKDVGLNDQVASALLAGMGSGNGGSGQVQ